METVLIDLLTDWKANCAPMSFYDDGITGVLWKVVKPSPWVFWIGLNSFAHCLWVGALLLSQLYQVKMRNSLNIESAVTWIIDFSWAVFKETIEVLS